MSVAAIITAILGALGLGAGLALTHRAAKALGRAEEQDRIARATLAEIARRRAEEMRIAAETGARLDAVEKSAEAREALARTDRDAAEEDLWADAERRKAEQAIRGDLERVGRDFAKVVPWKR